MNGLTPFVLLWPVALLAFLSSVRAGQVFRMLDVRWLSGKRHVSVALDEAGENACRASAIASSSRNQAIELLRIVSAFGVVAFHAGTVSTALPYAGLVVFLMLSPMIDTGVNFHRNRAAAALMRGFLVPWAFWLLVYGILNVVTGRAALPERSLPGLLYGSGVHLWFLPFMAGILALLDEAKRAVPSKALFCCSLAALFALLISLPAWRPLDVASRPPVAQWMHAVPAVIAGIVAGLAMTSVRRRMTVFLIIAPVLAYLVLSGVDQTYAAGMIATAAVGWSGSKIVPQHWDVRPLSSCMMGVYLTHMIWLDILKGILGHRGYTLVVATFAASLASVWLARRFEPGARVVLG